jgi:hypothetical protein
MTNPASSMGSLKSKLERFQVFRHVVFWRQTKGKTLWQERFLLAKRQTPVY